VFGGLIHEYLQVARCDRVLGTHKVEGRPPQRPRPPPTVWVPKTVSRVLTSVFAVSGAATSYKHHRPHRTLGQAAPLGSLPKRTRPRSTRSDATTDSTDWSTSISRSHRGAPGLGTIARNSAHRL
jgi:hypothetical protein